MGKSQIDDLFVEIPSALKLNRALNLPDGASEYDILKDIRALAAENTGVSNHPCFLGAGAYDSFIPSAVDQLISRSEFYTAYTPYQPEISQGTLQAIFEFQTMLCELTGLESANASMYDGATAVAEAALMMCAASNRKRIFVSEGVSPQARQVLATYLKYRDIEIVTIPLVNGLTDKSFVEANFDKTVAGILVQNPNFLGLIEKEAQAIGEIAHASKGLFTLHIGDALSLAIGKTPAELGADIAVGEAQSLGTPLAFGGPYIGFMTANSKQVRKLPGRIVGQSVDSDGKRAFVLTLQAREQHIRREKATSNICSNQGLNALMTTIYLSMLGKEGLREAAIQSGSKLQYLKAKLAEIGVKPAVDGHAFREMPFVFNTNIATLNEKLLQNGFIGGYDLSEDYPALGQSMLLCTTEKRSKEEIDALVLAIKNALEV
jgi:glycine dehydrogenase subunit 1